MTGTDIGLTAKTLHRRLEEFLIVVEIEIHAAAFLNVIGTEV